MAGVLVPAWAVSLAKTSSTQPIPADDARPASNVGPTENNPRAGSGLLIPLMAADTSAHELAAFDAAAEGAAPPDKPLDDIQFVTQASAGAREEIESAQQALSQLKNPELRRVAQMLVSDHGSANERLSRLASAKGWPVSGPRAPTEPPSGTASSDFDAKWTAEMIAGHERAAALYRAEAKGGADQDLRNYASDTLPTIERHLAQLRTLQK